MPAAKRLTDGIRSEIASLYIQDKTRSAKEVLVVIHEKLGRDDWPKLSVIQSEIKKIRDRNEANIVSGRAELDTPWHMGLMANPDYQISPEALAYIHLVQSWAEVKPSDVSKQPHEPITIRMALWISRVYGIIRIPPEPKEFQKLAPSIAHYLYQWAEAYATRERICELAGLPFETLSLDKSLREGGEPITAGKTTVTFFRKDNAFYIDTVDEKLIKQMEQMKKEGEK